MPERYMRLAGLGRGRELDRAGDETIVSPLSPGELQRALAYPKLERHISAEDGEAAMRWLRAGASRVEDPARDPLVRSVDPGDDPLIGLAAEQHAALVSGDGTSSRSRDRSP